MAQSCFFPTGTAAAVLTAEPIDRLLDYLAPEGGCTVGDFVHIPLGPRKVIGVVWAPATGEYDQGKLRRMICRLDLPPLGPDFCAFLERSADYTLTPLSQMLRLATRAPGLLDGPAQQRILRPTGQIPERMTAARQKVLDVYAEFGDLPFTPSELAQQAEVTPSVIKGLIEQRALIEEHAPRDTPFMPLDPNLPSKDLTDAQLQAADRLRADVSAGQYHTTLLRGITGSGKTEVYLEAVAECLRAGRQALVLLPEIALTSSFITRVEERFGARPAEWHSGVTATQRRRVWKMVSEGGAQLVVGARSALFLPFQDLGLIVVDEEHDHSYKQEDGVRYHARDMAVLRAALSQAQVVLVSATPSLETWVNAQNGKYSRVDLLDRFGAAVLPQMGAIDMRTQDLPSTRWISDELAQQIRSTMVRGEQALLFLNRRGFAPVTLCRACGHQLACPHCDARLVEHKFSKRLMCHQCGVTQPLTDTCPACQVTGKLAPIGPGIERIAAEAEALFPDARLKILSSDLFSSARRLRAAIEDIAAGYCDIIIGTQLVAKGHNFPRLSLVGVVDADLGLRGTDLRAAERCFQLIRQVSGRAGRADTPGRAILQTYQPEHPVIRAILSGDEEEFWAAEAEDRRAAVMPPFGRLIALILTGPNLDAAMKYGTALAARSDPLHRAGAQVFGPVPAPIARVRDQFRVRLLIKADKSVPVQSLVRCWLAAIPAPRNVRVFIDVDPQSFL